MGFWDWYWEQQDMDDAAASPKKKKKRKPRRKHKDGCAIYKNHGNKKEQFGCSCGGVK